MNKKWFLALSTLLLVCSGCSRLDSDTAAKEVESRLKKSESSIVVAVGKLSPHCILYVENGQEHERKIKWEDDTNGIIAMKAGYVTIVPEKDDFWTVTLTEKGRAAQDTYWSALPHHTDARGCDFYKVGFVVARPELVSVTEITGDMRTPQAAFQFKWKPTELGAGLQENGAIFLQLNWKDKIGLSTMDNDTGLKAPIPIPQEDQVQHQAAQFQKSNGKWQVTTLAVN